ncbi:hypothetical protein H0E87_009124, partial [Populus deltoides]
MIFGPLALSPLNANRFNIDDFEVEEEARPDFPCPYCYEDFDIGSLCSHLEDEHSSESKVAVVNFVFQNLIFFSFLKKRGPESITGESIDLYLNGLLKRPCSRKKSRGWKYETFDFVIANFMHINVGRAL